MPSTQAQLLVSTHPTLLHAGSQVPVGAIRPGEEDRIVRSPWPDVAIPEVTLADYVWENVDQYSDNTALVCGMTGRQYTYGLARGMATKFGSALARLGARRGDVLGMVLPNIPEFPIAFLGAVGAGLTVTTANPTYRAEEVARQFELSGAKFVLTLAMFLPNVKQ